MNVSDVLMYVQMYVYVYVMYVLMYVCMYVCTCTCTCMYVQMYVYIYQCSAHTGRHWSGITTSQMNQPPIRKSNHLVDKLTTSQIIHI